jgi:hypothetical protein
MRGWIVAGVLAGAAGCQGNVVSLGNGGDGGSAGTESDGGGAIIASGLQDSAPQNLASDGTSLFWVTGSPGGVGTISRSSVLGGPITTVVPAETTTGSPESRFLAVDDTSVYYINFQGDLYASVKDGAYPSFLISDGPASGVTLLGSNAYWAEVQQVQVGGALAYAYRVKTRPKSAINTDPISTIATFQTPSCAPGGTIIGVTTTTVFLSGGLSGLTSFPLATGVLDGGTAAQVPGGTHCEELVSDADAVYCDDWSSITRVTSDGTVTPLASVVTQSIASVPHVATTMAIDDTYVYWLDRGSDGAIRRVPKLGGPPSTLAHDNPIAITVDATAVYWSDFAGNIMRLPK